MGKVIKVKAYQTKGEDGAEIAEASRPSKESAATSAAVKKAGPAVPENTTVAGFTPDYAAEIFTVGNAYDVSTTQNAEAKTELAKHRNGKDDAAYDKEGVAELNGAKTAGDTAIDEAEDQDAVKEALANAKGAMPLGDHHYTTSKDEYDACIAAGWIGEGIGWYSDDAKGQAVLRVYNPNAYATGLTGAHHYTVNAGEAQALVALGWVDEQIGWYGIW